MRLTDNSITLLNAVFFVISVLLSLIWMNVSALSLAIHSVRCPHKLLLDIDKIRWDSGADVKPDIVHSFQFLLGKRQIYTCTAESHYEKSLHEITRMLKISWTEKLTNEEVLVYANEARSILKMIWWRKCRTCFQAWQLTPWHYRRKNVGQGYSW